MGRAAAGSLLFIAFCAGTMFQRLYCGAHFLSDLFGSAAVGLGWSYVCYHPRLMGTLFDKMEPEKSPRRRRRSARKPDAGKSSIAKPSDKPSRPRRMTREFSTADSERPRQLSRRHAVDLSWRRSGSMISRGTNFANCSSSSLSAAICLTTSC